MSGSSGGNRFDFDVPKDCNSLKIRTNLASPDPLVIPTLAIGDTLDVYLTPPVGPIQLIAKNGKIAGSILPIDLEQLINCITQGHDYVAKVLNISGANCEVLITHK